jgi:alpha-ketoglutarate-dependent sulfate ester dioxygenase
MNAITDHKAEAAGIQIQPLTPNTGAKIIGLKLRGDLSKDVVQIVRDAILKHKVVFFRDQQHLDEASQQAFGALLGKIVPHPTAPAFDGTEHVLDIDGRRARATFWHTDVSFVSAFPRFSILRSVVVPGVGGDTSWANDLKPELRELADRLWGLFTDRYEYAGRDADWSEERRNYQKQVSRILYETEHPLVQVHPETGERALILGAHLQRLIGYTSAESQRLIGLFQDHITRLENTVRWRWKVGDVAIWDNRATQHKAVDDYGTAERVLRRVVVDGDVAVGIDGRRSTTRQTEAVPEPA